MYRALFTAALLLLGSHALSEERVVAKVLKLPFKIAGVGWVDLPVSTAGALPAEDRKTRIEVAGLVVGPDKEDPRKATLAWTFGFTNKSMKVVESVRVEEVSPATVAILKIDDPTPALRDRYWIGSSVPIEATRETQSFLYEEGPSYFVFRFTIKERGKEPRTLLQVATFSQAAKDHFQSKIRKINEG
jgi:hypothetical protein